MMIVPAACSDNAGLSVLLEGSNPAEGHVDPDTESHGVEAVGVSIVATLSVDALAARLRILPTVLKIDVEGAEFALLQGAEKALRTTRPAVLLSTHSQCLRSACLDLLRTFGYRAEGLDRDETTPSQFLLTNEADTRHGNSA